MNTKSAMILFAHGARDPRWAQPFQRLQIITQASLPEVKVELASLFASVETAAPNADRGHRVQTKSWQFFYSFSSLFLFSIIVDQCRST